MTLKFNISAIGLLLSVFLLFSCNSNTRETTTDTQKQNPQESLIEVNKKLISNEDQQINAFINRHHWQMKETKTGLRYLIYQQGSGLKTMEGDEVEIAYNVVLLNGDTVYTSREKGHLVFTLGESDIANGLEEGILLLNQGSKAKFILPSHLAFGLLGDMDKIPARAALVYDIELINTLNNR